MAAQYHRLQGPAIALSVSLVLSEAIRGHAQPQPPFPQCARGGGATAISWDYIPCGGQSTTQICPSGMECLQSNSSLYSAACGVPSRCGCDQVTGQMSLLCSRDCSRTLGVCQNVAGAPTAPPSPSGPPAPSYVGPNPCAVPGLWNPALQITHENVTGSISCNLEAYAYFNELTQPSFASIPCSYANAVAQNNSINTGIVLADLALRGCCGQGGGPAQCGVPPSSGPRQLCTGSYTIYDSPDCSGTPNVSVATVGSCSPFLVDAGVNVYGVIARNGTSITGCYWSTAALCATGSAALARGASIYSDPALVIASCEETALAAGPTVTACFPPDEGGLQSNRLVASSCATAPPSPAAAPTSPPVSNAPVAAVTAAPVAYTGPNPCVNPLNWRPNQIMSHPNAPDFSCAVEAGAYFNNLTDLTFLTVDCSLVPNALAVQYGVNVGLILSDLVSHGCCGPAGVQATCSGQAAPVNPCADPSTFLPNAQINFTGINGQTCATETRNLMSGVASIATTSCTTDVVGNTSLGTILTFLSEAGCCGASRTPASCQGGGSPPSAPRQFCTGAYSTYNSLDCSGPQNTTYPVTQSCSPLQDEGASLGTLYVTLARNSTHILGCGWPTLALCRTGSAALASGAALDSTALQLGGCETSLLDPSSSTPRACFPASDSTGTSNTLEASSCGGVTAAPVAPAPQPTTPPSFVPQTPSPVMGPTNVGLRQLCAGSIARYSGLTCTGSVVQTYPFARCTGVYLPGVSGTVWPVTAFNGTAVVGCYFPSATACATGSAALAAGQLVGVSPLSNCVSGPATRGQSTCFTASSSAQRLTAVNCGGAAPSSDPPVSRAPTSLAPTSAAPVSAAPVSYAPVTVAPTTAANAGSAVTIAPTTLAPSTVAPTTHSPTTLSPFTASPTKPAASTGGKKGGQTNMIVIIACSVVAVLLLGVIGFLARAYICNVGGNTSKHQQFDNVAFDSTSDDAFDAEHPTFGGFSSQAAPEGEAQYEDDADATYA